MHKISKNVLLSSAYMRDGFTLLELLLVIAIVGIITGFVIPAVGSAKSFQLTRGVQMVVNQLALARQTAVTKNHPVEVRFYQFGDPDIPGEQASNPSSGKYRAVWSFEVLETGETKALEKMQRLPPSVIIDSGSILASLINPPSATASPTVTAAGKQTSPIPRVQNQYNSVAFRFLPDGSTNLPKTSDQQWFLTLHDLNDGDVLTTPPKNFATLQINATNGHIKTYRP